MKKTLLAIASIGLLSASLAIPAFSHNPGGNFRGHHMGPGYQMGGGAHHGPWYADEAMTEEQRKKIDQLGDTFAGKTKGLRLKITEKANQLYTLRANPDADKGEIQKTFRELNTLRNALAEQQLEFSLKAQEIAPEAYSRNGYCNGPGPGFGGGHHNMMPW